MGVDSTRWCYERAGTRETGLCQTLRNGAIQSCTCVAARNVSWLDGQRMLGRKGGLGECVEFQWQCTLHSPLDPPHASMPHLHYTHTVHCTHHIAYIM